LFVLFCFKPPEQFFSYPAAVTITGDRAANFGLCSALRVFEQGGIFIVPTPTVTRDLGFYGLIRKTDTHVPQWDLNPDAIKM
jgi:hypothetical protein